MELGQVCFISCLRRILVAGILKLSRASNTDCCLPSVILILESDHEGHVAVPWEYKHNSFQIPVLGVGEKVSTSPSSHSQVIQWQPVGLLDSGWMRKCWALVKSLAENMILLGKVLILTWACSFSPFAGDG